jgi:hypothetical protein
MVDPAPTATGTTAEHDALTVLRLASLAAPVPASVAA